MTAGAAPLFAWGGAAPVSPTIIEAWTRPYLPFPLPLTGAPSCAPGNSCSTPCRNTLSRCSSARPPRRSSTARSPGWTHSATCPCPSPSPPCGNAPPTWTRGAPFTNGSTNGKRRGRGNGPGPTPAAVNSALKLSSPTPSRRFRACALLSPTTSPWAAPCENP